MCCSGLRRFEREPNIASTLRRRRISDERAQEFLMIVLLHRSIELLENLVPFKSASASSGKERADESNTSGINLLSKEHATPIDVW